MYFYLVGLETCEKVESQFLSEEGGKLPKFPLQYL